MACVTGRGILLCGPLRQTDDVSVQNAVQLKNLRKQNQKLKKQMMKKKKMRQQNIIKKNDGSPTAV